MSRATGTRRGPWEGAEPVPEARRPASGQPINPRGKGGSCHTHFRACAPSFQRFWAPACSHSHSSPPRRRSQAVPAELRVVDANGKTLAEQTQYTGAVPIKTDPKADCFGPGTGGSGDKAKLDSANALGLIADGGIASRT